MAQDNKDKRMKRKTKPTFSIKNGIKPWNPIPRVSSLNPIWISCTGFFMSSLLRWGTSVFHPVRQCDTRWAFTKIQTIVEHQASDHTPTGNRNAKDVIVKEENRTVRKLNAGSVSAISLPFPILCQTPPPWPLWGPALLATPQVLFDFWQVLLFPSQGLGQRPGTAGRLQVLGFVGAVAAFLLVRINVDAVQASEEKQQSQDDDDCEIKIAELIHGGAGERGRFLSSGDRVVKQALIKRICYRIVQGEMDFLAQLLSVVTILYGLASICTQQLLLSCWCCRRILGSCSESKKEQQKMATSKHIMSLPELEARPQWNIKYLAVGMIVKHPG